MSGRRPARPRPSCQLDFADDLHAVRRRSSRRSTCSDVGLLSDGAPSGKRLSNSADQLVDVASRSTNGQLLGDLVEHEVAADVVDVGAQHQQVVGRLHRHEPVAADLDRAGVLEHLDRPRPSRSRSGSPSGVVGSAGSTRLLVADQRQAEDAVADVERLLHRAQVEPQVVGRAEPVPVQVGQRLLVLAAASARSRAARSGRRTCGGRSGRPCGPTAYGAPPRSRTARPSRRTSPRPARRGPRRGCRSWRRRPARSRRRSAARAGRCRAARCRGRRGRAGTTRGRGPRAS